MAGKILKNESMFFLVNSQIVLLEVLRMKVQPITDVKHIKKIKRLLSNKPRDLLLFVMGINSGLRVQDLLTLKVADVQSAKAGDRIVVVEKKTGKPNIIIINDEILVYLAAYLQSISDSKATDYLFKSRKGANYPLNTLSVTHMVKEWCQHIKLEGNFGAHTLRKTFCYMQRTLYGTSWEVLCRRLNHSSPAITMRYLGVRPEEVENILSNTIG